VQTWEVTEVLNELHAEQVAWPTLWRGLVGSNVQEVRVGFR
jgi:hypothetical protein